MGYPSLMARTKNWGTEILTDTDLEGQLDLIIDWVNDAQNSSSGHKHDGTTSEGPKIATLAAIVAGSIAFSTLPTVPTAAPTADADLANKKYIDDQISDNAVTSSVATGTSDITTAGTVYGDMADMTLPLTGAGTYIFMFNAVIKLSSSGASTVTLALDIDGTDVVETLYGGYSIGGENPVGRIPATLIWPATITTETTAKIEWKHGTAASTQYGTESTRVFTFIKIA